MKAGASKRNSKTVVEENSATTTSMPDIGNAFDASSPNNSLGHGNESSGGGPGNNVGFDSGLRQPSKKILLLKRAYSWNRLWSKIENHGRL